MKLSVCLATFQEEKNIHYALDSIIHEADEVVIVDGGSTDGTVDILHRYGPKVRVIAADNPPMFHINKQKAIEDAQGEWILQLDADEEITRELWDEIQTIIKSSAKFTSVFAYQIPRRNFFLGRPLMKGGVYPDYTIRLYRRGTVYFPCKDVHENVTPVYKTGETQWLGTIQNPMNHYSDPSFGRYFDRWKRYNKAEAQRVLGQARSLYAHNAKRILQWKVMFVIKAVFVLPPYWFFKTYIRHKGFQDGWQGFLFHAMSALRWWGIAYGVLTG